MYIIKSVISMTTSCTTTIEKNSERKEKRKNCKCKNDNASA
jgi:hypothetical protein